MGLMTITDGEEDVAALYNLGLDLAAQWNESAAGSEMGYGFQVQSVEDDCKKVCTIGTRVLKDYFSDPPSAFKRTAAVIVLGRLFPFIGFIPERSDASDEHRWLARLMVTMVPVALRSIKVSVVPCQFPHTPINVTLKGFKQWPSVHVKAEFIEWMSSLDSLPDLTDAGLKEGDAKVADQRLARMIMAASLIIENAYYCMECAPAIPTAEQLRTKCFPCIEKISTSIDLVYEKLMIEPPPATELRPAQK